MYVNMYRETQKTASIFVKNFERRQKDVWKMSLGSPHYDVLRTSRERQFNVLCKI